MKIWRRIATSIVAIGLATSSLVSAYASDTRSVDIVAVTWPLAQASPVSVQDVRQSLVNSVSPNWKKFTTTQGESDSKTIDFVPGIVSDTPINLTRPMACEGVSSMNFMSAMQREFYGLQGIKDYRNRYLIILTPNAGCVWLGKAILGDASSKGGVMVLHNTAESFVITHELGHTFGIGHTNFLYCRNGASDGAWSNTCSAIEYGGTIDVMGNIKTDSPLSTYHLWRMGFIENSKIRESWINESIQLTASDVEGPTRAIFLRDGKSTYWIEYRRGEGNVKPGLAIFRTDPPPISFVQSPNPADALANEYTSEVSSDLWMLNWDNYTYTSNRTASSGSMTLPDGKTATVFSGNISLSAKSTSNPAVVNVEIRRKADTTSPPTPSILNPSSWQSGQTDIVIKGKEDFESKIAFFEKRVDGVVSKVTPTTPKNWLPTFLNPLAPNPTVYVDDLTEGSYQLAIRSVDMWGNVSAWSDPIKITVDRTLPTLTNEIQVQKIAGEKVSLAWTGVRDDQSGLCEFSLANNEGWNTYKSVSKNAPMVSIPANTEKSYSATAFDCFGNGIKSSVNISNVVYSPSTKGARSGKWSSQPDGLRCKGKCSISLSVSGTVSVSLTSGSADTFLTAKPAGRVTSTAPRIIKVGSTKRTLRVQGSNFTISNIASASATVSPSVEVQRPVAPTDLSLLSSEQQELSKFGFKFGDFDQSWSIAPMNRGTTLLDPTLDLCGESFTSESGRVARRQVIATKPDSKYAFLSTEVVQYANSTAANNALNELNTVLNRCKLNKGGLRDGVFTPYNFHEVKSVPDNLVLENSRVIINATMGASDSSQQLLAIYQYKGPYFVGLYLIRYGQTQFSNTEISDWLDVAGDLANRFKSST